MGERGLTQPPTKLEKKEERERVGRTRNKEMVDIRARFLKLNLFLFVAKVTFLNLAHKTNFLNFPKA